MKYSDITVSDSIKYVGVNDYDLDLFEGQYIIPNGVAYNSYVIFDEKIAVMDTVDKRACSEWLENLEAELGARVPDYLVVQHMEPDHAASIQVLAEKYPDMEIVGNVKTFAMIERFFDIDLSGRKVTVSEGDTLSLGKHNLTFVMAPMIHWPEVMLTYESSEKVLFSADAFGKFGALDTDEDWACEARRYYFNIVGKYGAQVQALLKKAAALDISIICPLHGPVLKENLGYYINLYDIWSSYRPEQEGVFIAYASIYGNTKAGVEFLADELRERGVKVAVSDLSRDDWAEAVEDAFKYDRLVVASPTYDGGIFTSVHEFIEHLKAKTYRNRRVAIIENGTWAPMAGKKIRAEFEAMKDIEIIEPVVTINSAVKAETKEALSKLADAIAAAK
ncbi:MAG TPA: FprA family A-type flavoprotein [Candidatus Monoglobus merdigallinarum]|uniref:FprA family A-type flavoprotein n=1 Tax=Candidatus Monoglobus merdigallinarum TaxID=2838698 RepID=A0A9D1TM51_9FIRM|nr:FprA family A-type flavoprotein [Candidatus Monoglobus merdigallinarum]